MIAAIRLATHQIPWRRCFRLSGILLLACYLYYALQLRAVYLYVLAEFGPRSIPTLVEALDDKGEAVQMIAVNKLGAFGTPAVSPLVRALNDTNSVRRAGAAKTLGRMASQQPSALPALQAEAAPALASKLEDADGRVRVEAASALWSINKDPKKVVPTLIQAWREEDLAVRFVAQETLQFIGSDAKEALPAFMEALSDERPIVSQWAKDSIKAIDPKGEHRKDKVKK